jgi:preprotein translocase subunit SecA
VERREVESTYCVDSFDVPPNRKCLRVRLPTRVLKTKAELTGQLLKLVDEMRAKSRPLLLLFLSIDDSVAFSRELEAKNVKHSVLNERQREDEDYIVFRAGQPGAVTVATNTAGRGTDIVLSPAARAAGALHVAFTFFPENFRVECQGLGRAGRQGEPGTAEIVTSQEDPFVKQLCPVSEVKDMAAFVELLYAARSAHVKSMSDARAKRCRVETQLFAGLTKSFVALQQVKERFAHNAAFLAELAKQGGPRALPPHEIEQLVLAHLKQRWAQLFTPLANDRDAGPLPAEYYPSEYADIIARLLQDDPAASSCVAIALATLVHSL